MAKSRGEARNAQKQKKRRRNRQLARAAKAAKRWRSASPRTEQPLERIRQGPAAGELSADELADIGYNPRTGPNAEQWLALDEQERMARVVRYHELALADGAQPPGPDLHATAHVVVENQLASDVPPEIRPTLVRLKNEGMTRHDAIHALGSMLMRHLHKSATHPDRMNLDVYREELRNFSLSRWLDAMQPDPDATE